MICSVCLESDPQCFYKEVCRRCLRMHVSYEATTGAVVEYQELSFKLTPDQQVISDRLVEIVENQSVFVDAVCGAGKTEICLDLVRRSVVLGKRIAWVIPRREVVLEIALRLSEYFPNLKVTPICEGYLDCLEGDIIVATTHQMFRFRQAFDIIILDEPDAFPFKDNELLERYVHLACKGSMVYLSATYHLDGIETLKLTSRPSGVALPEPKVKCVSVQWFQLFKDLLSYKEEKCLIFVPTQKLARRLSIMLNCAYITSKTEDKASCIKTFREEGGCLVTTTVLERGVTFLDCFVFVYQACHRVFDESSLVQIAGRAMRGMTPQKGLVIFYCSEYTKSINDACERIHQANHDAGFV